MKAFPYNPQFNQEHNGMDLRDYFAGQILSKLIELGIEHDEQIITSPTYVSKRAYIYADAMMKAREITNGK
jgi:hypothetical protein